MFIVLLCVYCMIYLGLMFIVVYSVISVYYMYSPRKKVNWV